MSRTVLVTGARGFVGSNLMLHLQRRPDLSVIGVGRDDDLDAAITRLSSDDIVFHLAGVNRPISPDEFATGNAGLTELLCDKLAARGIAPTLVLSSSIQAALDNPYGISKRQGEDCVREYGRQNPGKAVIYRLPNVFGKWARPNYNSVVATFCNNIANHLPIQVNDPGAPLTLLYVDDLISTWLDLLDGSPDHADQNGFGALSTVYHTTVGELASTIESFRTSRQSLITEPVGRGLARALHATYLSYLRPEQFSYGLTTHADARGEFVEMIKTNDSGQVSFFTCRPGITRGGHFHHSKTEKFLVVCGRGLFKFRHMVSGETAQLETSDQNYQIVETVPGWTHDITNIGDDDMIVMLWANEIFDPQRPDTYQEPVDHAKP
ncbi:UDP-2-acetamido-2,6-beta-L-arabino-hexul-4-ose reductase [Devosia subaequoris]|uniref:UDP-2-acetamido-2,6-beta-L-arabino-hexul-4-ose reductase n=1 Tax=Devosia subaequoris TaxID=395930 RepID=A0A7W6IKG5_9HYPH|nr:NAD-dependent epimerase/dehydratase family protein [Devosia subaequoris]MBB4051300.1 UDP-2-acetamido-2,6-beta-L-arabino-hexul-4-ose reductase [Devosia subaequoris]MCP1211403.1 NAD-dependent epimerase/dehydratase family protein [Devosia subaequoris]